MQIIKEYLPSKTLLYRLITYIGIYRYFLSVDYKIVKFLSLANFIGKDKIMSVIPLLKHMQQ